MKSYTKKKKLIPKEHTPEPNNGQPVVKFVWAQVAIDLGRSATIVKEADIFH